MDDKPGKWMTNPIELSGFKCISVRLKNESTHRFELIPSTLSSTFQFLSTLRSFENFVVDLSNLVSPVFNAISTFSAFSTFSEPLRPRLTCLEIYQKSDKSIDQIYRSAKSVFISSVLVAESTEKITEKSNHPAI